MADKDNQFVAFHEGQEVDVPEEVKVAKPEVKPTAPIDVPYITRENEPVTAEPNFILKGDPSLDRPTYTGYESAGQTDKLDKEEKSRARKEKSSSFVTRKFLIICMVIAIVVSTLLGAGIAMALGSRNSDSKEHDNLSESSLSAATGSKLTIAQIVEKNADAVVEIVVESTAVGMWGQTTLQEGAGSGVIVNADGYIVTNYHVIDGAKSVTVTLHNGDEYKATVVGGDYAGDLAVVKINPKEGKELTVATLGDSSKVAVGDLAVAIGNPLGQLGGTVTSGIVSALDRQLTIEDRTLTLMQTDAAINPGNSGGGLFNGAGDLIGIVESKTAATEIEGLAFAIPINAAKDTINQLITDGKVSGKPSIGVAIYDISDENAEYYNLDGAGVYIAQVTGDNASKAGFKESDKIVTFNGEKIKDSADLISKVRACKIGDIVKVGIIRDGTEITIKTKLEESVATAGSSKQQKQQQQQQQQPNSGIDGLDGLFDEFGW